MDKTGTKGQIKYQTERRAKVQTQGWSNDRQKNEQKTERQIE